MLRSIMLAALCVGLMGCAADDPFVTVVQETTTTISAVDGGPDNSTDDTDPATETDDPLADFPQPEGIVDLRGLPTVEVVVNSNTFDGGSIRVDPGTQIVFANFDAEAHNVRSAIAGAFPTIDKDLLFTEPQALVLTEPGDYPFYCSLHGTSQRGQLGYIVVGDG
ncbi:MAG: hypothetical protein P8J50_15505 [Acidimicrobiales bacterium]|jgi:plastocyanin|nr:hypothetical protein [Acidimicrobiales bacterium]